MSEQIIRKPITKQFLDKSRPDPNLPPRNTSAGIQGDLPCSSPGCPNFCNDKCGFCEHHCKRFHHGIHYDKGLKADIPDGVKNFLDLQSGSTIEWKMDVINNERVAVINKKELKQA